MRKSLNRRSAISCLGTAVVSNLLEGPAWSAAGVSRQGDLRFVAPELRSYAEQVLVIMQARPPFSEHTLSTFRNDEKNLDEEPLSSIPWEMRSVPGRSGRPDVAVYLINLKPDTLKSSAGVPSRAANLAGLPPAWIGVGGIDLFLEEDIGYARRLLAADVPTEILVEPGAFHGFDVIASETSIAKRFTAAKFDALRRAMT